MRIWRRARRESRRRGAVHLRFPEDRAVGTLEYGPIGAGRVEGRAATGDVLIAGDDRIDVHLTVDAAVTDLSFLARLPDGALHALDLRALGGTSDRHPNIDGALRQLDHLIQLRRLSLAGTAVTAVGLAHLATLTGLFWLDLARTPVTDAGLVHLAGLSALRDLDLSATAITDAGLTQIAHLNALGELGLAHTAVTDAGLAHLTGLAALHALDLSFTAVTDAGLALLPGVFASHWHGLRALDLTGTAVTDAGMAHLVGFDELMLLGLEGTAVTDAGLVQIADLARHGLIAVRLAHTAVTAAAVAALRATAPRLEIDLGVERTAPPDDVLD